MTDSLIPGRKGRTDSPRAGPLLRFPTGAILFDSGHPSRCIYLLRSGHIQIFRNRQVIFDFIKPGCLFGEKCLLPGLPRPQVAKTVSPVTVVEFPSSELLDRLRRDPGLGLRLLRGMAARLDRYEQIISGFVTEIAEERLARLLWRLMRTRPASGWVRLRYSPTNLELARTIGTTRWRVSRFLSHFQQLGWLRRKNGLWIHREHIMDFLGESRNREIQ